MSDGLRVAYVVLHYNTIEDTKKCIESIRAFSESPIVIVCNGSSNGKDEEVSNDYMDQSNVHTIISKDNQGFARGNNLGIEYIQKRNLSDMIVCVNNDVIFTDQDFEKVICDEYRASHYGVGGVDVVNPFGIHCNPTYADFPDIETVEDSLKTYKKAISRCKTLHGIAEIAHLTVKRIFTYFNRSQRAEEGNTDRLMMLHGCCIILSPLYLNKHQGLCPLTYLYGEEIILSYQCHIDNVLVKYIGTTAILHNESISTKTEYSNVIKRKLFYYENIYESTKVLRGIIEGTLHYDGIGNKGWMP